MGNRTVVAEVPGTCFPVHLITLVRGIPKHLSCSRTASDLDQCLLPFSRLDMYLRNMILWGFGTHIYTQVHQAQLRITGCYRSEPMTKKQSSQTQAETLI